MPDLPHLPLRRVEYEEPRKKKRGFGSIPQRSFQQHGQAIGTQIQAALQDLGRPRPRGVNPQLILRVKLAGHIDEDALRRSNLTLVGQTDDKTLVLFSSDTHMQQFQDQLRAYEAGPPHGQKNAPYANIFSNIDEVGRIQPTDRIGRLFRASGIQDPAQLTDATLYTVDLELWHTGNTQECRTKLDEIRQYVTTEGGRITDDYIGAALVLARVKANGNTIKSLLAIDAVATIDLPPKVSLRVSQQLDVGLQDLGAIPQPPETASSVCILDSGITSGHPLLGPAIGEATAVPAQLGNPADENGHGTMVAGLALYGDVQQCIDQRRFIPQLRLYSARVLNADNKFDDESLITTQMRKAIEYFKNTYGCKVFNCSLGDPDLPYNGGKVSPWASILDHLSRELDVVIVVSAGNYEHEPTTEQTNDHHINGYPHYLLQPPAKIIEPATGCIVLTVGSLASSANTPPHTHDRVTFQPIAQPSQPSPFTRSGPGIGGAIKPEVCEYGGNIAYNATLGEPQDHAELSVVSLNKDYVQRLFRSDFGTSYAAPRVAHLAARLAGQFPHSSANLIRALIAASAQIPQAARDILDPIEDATLSLCGYGVPDMPRASTSDNNRVVLYAQNALPSDKFHIYEVPIPDEIYQGNGERRISVTLAFDPPVRHSRLDYLGTTLSYRLIRGKSVEEVAAAFKQPGSTEQHTQRIGGAHNCDMIPKPTMREGSTLQRATFTMRRAPQQEYGDTYFLVVRCERQWALDEHFPQRYALVVTLEHQEQVDLYTRIQARLQVPIRLQARATATT